MENKLIILHIGSMHNNRYIIQKNNIIFERMFYHYKVT